MKISQAQCESKMYQKIRFHRTTVETSGRHFHAPCSRRIAVSLMSTARHAHATLPPGKSMSPQAIGARPQAISNSSRDFIWLPNCPVIMLAGLASLLFPSPTLPYPEDSFIYDISEQCSLILLSAFWLDGNFLT